MQVAEAIADQIKSEGHEAELRNVREDYPSPPKGDFLFVGSPIRMKSATRQTRKFVKRLDGSEWKDKPVVAFVTIGKMKENPTEADKANFKKISTDPGIEFRGFINDRGLKAYDQVLYVEVEDGWKGPLVDDGVEKTKKFAHDFLLTLKN